MGSTMNLVMTSFGFAVSAIFIVFLSARLLCARLRGSRRFAERWAPVDAIAIERATNGMDPGAVSLFPTIKYSREVFTSTEDAICIICLIGYEEREILRILPQCGHTFHINCIEAWLRQQSTCPICRICLQSSPVQRNVGSPLLSTAARSRFSPGAIPESFFESPTLTFSSAASAFGESSPRECEICGNFKACNCDADATRTGGQQMHIDLQSLNVSESVRLEEQQCGEASQCPSDDDLPSSRKSPISYKRIQPEQGCNSCHQRGEAENEEVVEEKSCVVEVKGRSEMNEKCKNIRCSSVGTYEPKQAFNKMMVGLEKRQSIEGETTDSLCKEKAVQEDHIGLVNGSMEDKHNCEQERYSLNLWVGDLQQGSMQKIRNTVVDGAVGAATKGRPGEAVLGMTSMNCLVEAEIESRPEDVILGWAPAISPLSSSNVFTTRSKLDG